MYFAVENADRNNKNNVTKMTIVMTLSMTSVSKGRAWAPSLAPRALASTATRGPAKAIAMRTGGGVQGRVSIAARSFSFEHCDGMHESEKARAGDHVPEIISVDFLVLGSGIAGLSYALKVAEYGDVAIVTKGEAVEGCTRYAQGGISAVLDAHDSVGSHVKDTLIAGAYLNDIKAVKTVCSEGPARVLELAAMGAEFSMDGVTGELHLTKEGGHSARRVVHAADATGAEIERAMLAQAVAHPNITFYEHKLAVDLVKGEDANGSPVALGADVLCLKEERLYRFVALSTLLATGGAGQVYPMTTNPLVSTGDGIAMAHRAEAAVENMEFVQFHPTALYGGSHGRSPGDRGTAFLISEAVRGEGGVLLSADGKSRFMEHIDPRKELAPRDIVARAIQSEMRHSGSNNVLLDISHMSKEKVLCHFPNIASHCRSIGIDITTDPIPVLPAQHYLCGGVKAGLYGQTNIPGLFACGEVACSGLHGANRLASNSLLEGLVFGARAVTATVEHRNHVCNSASLYHNALMRVRKVDTVAERWGRPPRGLSEAAHAWVQAKRTRLQDIMWDAAGIVRDHERMKQALQEIADLYVESRVICETYGVNRELVELRNIVTVGELILSSALQRKESRGGHFRADYPRSVPVAASPTIILTSAIRRLNLGSTTNTTQV